MKITSHHIRHGDARSMSDVPDNSAHLVVTSPPYWQLKDYGTTTDEGQIGFHDSYEDYINNLNLVWMECFRALHPGCRLCVNIGDQFARAVYYGRYKVIPIRTEIIRFCEAIGFDYMGAVIWQKVTTTNTTGGAAVMGSFPYPRNGIIKIDYEFILLFKKLGNAPKVSKEQKEASKMTTEEWNRYFYGHWDFPGEKQANHLAAFPVELPHRLIRMFSFVEETVLDPFLGSGTTTAAAINTGRNSIGYEINPDYVERTKVRVASLTQDLWKSPFKVEYKESSPVNGHIDEAVNRLPYLFRTTNQLTRILDPHSRQFGSRISERQVLPMR